MASIAIAESKRTETRYRVFQKVMDWTTEDRMQLINISDRIDAVVRDSGISSGLVHIQSLHTTTSVFLNEWQDALGHDVQSFLSALVSRQVEWRHNDPRYS